MREYACRAIDVLARRTRLAFTNVYAAKEALPRIVDIMGQELDWSEQRKKVGQSSECVKFVKEVRWHEEENIVLKSFG